MHARIGPYCSVQLFDDQVHKSLVVLIHEANQFIKVGIQVAIWHCKHYVRE